jgi:protein-tyrosine phosphatase
VLLAVLAGTAAACAPGPPELDDARRHVVLDGAINFRDLGGYRTGDGRTVRWGQVYRSDDLAGLSAADLATLRRLDVKVICNLQTDIEHAAAAERPPGSMWPEVLYLPVGTGRLTPADIRARILGGTVEGDELAVLLTDEYRAFVTDFSPTFGAMLGRLADPHQLPTVVHCTQGKDRTGFAAAIVLLTLGVPRATVLEDYLLTNDFRAWDTRWTLALAFVGSRFRVTPAELRPLLEARREYLLAALATIDERYGSFEVYLRDGLGVAPTVREELRRTLLD